MVPKSESTFNNFAGSIVKAASASVSDKPRSIDFLIFIQKLSGDF